MTANHQSQYRWYILTLATATHIFVVAMPRMCMPVLFSEIADELGLNLVQIGTVWGMSSLAGVLIGLGGGLIGDWYGTKRTLTLTCLVAGIIGALRGFADSFTWLSVTMFFFGFVTTTTSLSVHKAAGEWFSGRHLGIANGVLAAGMGSGFMLGSMISATVLSPLLGGWRNVLFLYGAISLVISLLWSLSRHAPRPARATHPQDTVPLRQALSRVFRIRNVWLLALIRMCFSGGTQGFAGYLPLYLRGQNWPAASADGALAAYTGASMVGVIPLSLLSDRLGLRKQILLVTVLVITAGIGLLSTIDGTLVWPLVIVAGLLREGTVAITITMVMETEGVGGKYAGTALGITVTLMNLGGFIAPPLGNALAGINPGLPFAFWAAMVMAAFVVLLFVAETGRRRSGLTNKNEAI